MTVTYKALVLESAADASPVLKDLPLVAPGRGEVAVRIHAAALNHRDVWIWKGQYAGIRYPVVPGSDGAGVVEQVGAEVDARWVSQRVIINPSLHWGGDAETAGPDWRILGMPDAGTFAERIVVPVNSLAPLPAHLSFEEGAALPLAGLTAHRALFFRGRLRSDGPPEKVLVTGAGGGVAQFLIQFARAAGATVFVTSGSEEKLQRARALGAAGGVNYHHDGWEKALADQAGPFDLVVDSAGGPSFPALCDLTRPGGRLVFLGATAGDPPTLPLRKIFWRQLSLLGTTMGSPQDFAAMTRLVSASSLRPVIDSVVPLADAAAALRRMDAGQQYGKLVLAVSASHGGGSGL